MIRRNPNGDLPDIHPDAFVDPTAIICGKVIVSRHVFIGPYAVIRADETDDQGNLHPILIGEGTNIQDGVVMHSKDGGPITIGRHSSIAHRAIVHGPCEVGDTSLSVSTACCSTALSVTAAPFVTMRLSTA